VSNYYEVIRLGGYLEAGYGLDLVANCWIEQAQRAVRGRCLCPSRGACRYNHCIQEASSSMPALRE
jgi:hypothetical protein